MPTSRPLSALPTAPLHVPAGDSPVADMPAPPACSLISLSAAWNSSERSSDTGSALMLAKAATGNAPARSLGEGDVVVAGGSADVVEPRAATRRTRLSANRRRHDAAYRSWISMSPTRHLPSLQKDDSREGGFGCILPKPLPGHRGSRSPDGSNPRHKRPHTPAGSGVYPAGHYAATAATRGIDLHPAEWGRTVPALGARQRQETSALSMQSHVTVEGRRVVPPGARMKRATLTGQWVTMGRVRAGVVAEPPD